MKLIYIAGQYIGKTSERIDLNISAARHAACQAIERGWFPITPHANTAQFDRFMPDVPHSFWYEGDLLILGKCDAALFIQGWENSKGSKAEHEFCLANNIPIYYMTNDLPNLKEQQ